MSIRARFIGGPLDGTEKFIPEAAWQYTTTHLIQLRPVTPDVDTADGVPTEEGRYERVSLGQVLATYKYVAPAADELPEQVEE